MVTAGLADSLDAHARVLATGRRIRPTDDFPLSRLVDKAIPDLELHRQDAARRWRRRLLLGLRLSLRRCLSEPGHCARGAYAAYSGRDRRRCMNWRPSS